jgi:hypothetical protein
VLDGALQAELAEPVLLTLLHLGDDPTTRRRFRPFLELQAVLAPFSSMETVVGPSPERAAFLEASHFSHVACWMYPQSIDRSDGI